MLLDPSCVDRPVDAAAGGAWQSPRAAAARHRPPDSVLTLPGFAADVPREATIRWRADVAVEAVVLEQFRYGPLRAADVHAPVSPVDAFQQAFYAWVQRQIREPFRFLSFGLDLFDTNAVMDILEHGYGVDEFRPDGPLHLGVRLENEWLHEMGVLAQPLREAHPLLLYTLFDLVDRVSGKTVLIRTPGWFLCEAACRHWDGDEAATDADVSEWMKEYYGEDEEVVNRFLPSVLRPELYPDEIRMPAKVPGRRSRSQVLSGRELRHLQSGTTPLVARVCVELAALHRLLGRAGNRPLLNDGHDARPLYSGCSLVLESNERIGELLDDFMNGEYQGGEATEYSCFITFSNNRRGICAQYAQWSLALQMLRHLDRLLALVVSP
ncbi:PRTRC system protein F [Paraburkholderia kururiensis]|uniref:PRTRC system protein F n=1 Tax=Paraburkholderia kururiensis TaxID=984307 RepID=UPI003B7E50CA